MRSLVLLAGVCALSGCASVVSRSHANHDRWYPGTQQIWRDLSIDPWYSQSLDLVDLPLSAVADTVLLPWDAIVRSDHRGPEPELLPPAPEPVAMPLPLPAPAVAVQPEPVAVVPPVPAVQPEPVAQVEPGVRLEPVVLPEPVVPPEPVVEPQAPQDLPTKL